MATPVFCCGAECGVDGVHLTLTGTGSISTGTVRSGARSYRANGSASRGYWSTTAITSATVLVVRFLVRFADLPDGDDYIFWANTAGVGFKSSDSKLYPAYGNAVDAPTFGSDGVAVTTGVWYVVNVKIDVANNPWTIDLKVDGTSTTQLTKAVAASSVSNFNVGTFRTGVSPNADIFIDDIVVSQTSGDYPIGDGYVNHFIPTSDGTHNVAGANDFERSATGTDIINSTTDAYQLIDDVPLKSGVVSEYINLIAPPNATDYVEVVFGPASGISTPTAAPRAVEAIVAHASATTGTHNLRIALNDNGSLDDVLNTTTAPGTTAAYARKHYSDPPSAASAWTLSGNGNFNNVRMRCFTNDAAPDPWWASAMIEAEFATVVAAFNTQRRQQTFVKQAVKRAAFY